MPTMASFAIFMPSAETEKMLTVPSSSMLISQPDSSTRRLMFFPPGPMSAPIFSGLIFTTSMRGAYLLNSVRGAPRVLAISARMCIRATRDFAIHVAIMIFPADDVGKELIFGHFFAAVFGANADADAGDRTNHRNARVHERQRAAANARH